LFPEAENLFEKLAKSEERHADILTICLGFENIHEVPGNIIPLSSSNINETIMLAECIKSGIEKDRFSLEKLLSMLLKMEKSLAEKYLHENLTKKTESDVISYLQQFYKDEQSHAEVIKKFMSDKEFLSH
jgi:rubrerythrin